MDSRVLLLAAAISLVPQFPAKPVQAQEGGARDARAGKDSDGAALLSLVEQLRSTVERQQRALAEMQKRIDALEKAAPVTSTAPRMEGVQTTLSPGREPIQVPPAPKSESGFAGWNNSHAFIRNGDGSFETRIAGYAQLDFRGYQGGEHPPNTFLVRRARLGVEGRLQRYYDFKLEGDFADAASTLLRDFYVNVHRVDQLQFRFGQFRVPFSQEEIRADNVQDFVERSLVNNLAPSRSPGMAVTGVLGKGVFEYQAGLFNGKGLLAPNNNGTPEGALRLRLSPWKNTRSYWARGLSFGGAGTSGRSVGGMGVRGQTESRSFTFFSPDVLNGAYTRANGELTWLLGPAAIRAEYDQTNQHRDQLGPAGTNLPGVVAKGWMAQATWLLTGEPKPEADAVVPRRELFARDGTRHGFGAWELKVRFASLQISDGTAQNNRAETLYFGPNWYLNRYVRYMLDFGWERFGDPARTPRKGERGFGVILNRIQVAF